MSIPFKDRLKKWRGNRTVKEAADILNIDVWTYYHWESGKRVPRERKCRRCIEQVIDGDNDQAEARRTDDIR